MFYLTLRKRKLSPVPRDASANAAGEGNGARITIV